MSCLSPADFLRIFLFSLTLSFIAPEIAEANKQPFEVRDYFGVSRIVELGLSSDGQMVAYVVESTSLEKNKALRAVHVSPAVENVESVLIGPIQSARSLAWIPETNKLAFLESNGGIAQIYSIDVDNERIDQYTHGDAPVVNFRFAPTGDMLAWLTLEQSGAKPSLDFPSHKRSGLHDRLHNGDRGVVIDSENTNVYHFIDPERPKATMTFSHDLWVKSVMSEPYRVEVPGKVQGYHWSSDGRKLSISYIGNEIEKNAVSDRLLSIGVFDLVANSFQVVADARSPSQSRRAQYYSGGEWLPGKDKLFLRRTTEKNLWTRSVEWALVDISAGDSLDIEKQVWKEIEVYGSDSDFMPASESVVYSNRTIEAKRTLYNITPLGAQKANILQEIEGSVSLVQFSSDFETVVFVNERMNQPPEIFIKKKGRAVEKISRLNDKIASKSLPFVREMRWMSGDGTEAQGWLLLPADYGSHGSVPLPLVTFVHGGPTFVIRDGFAIYFGHNGGIWPYPFEVYAHHGMAVFLPNYRGTGSFGKEYASPKSADGEPVDDIISGIAYLVAEGVADPDRLAISGHSHGAWLGALVMARSKIFRAGSFSEGPLNMMVTYSLMSGYLNRVTHDVLLGNGTSLFEDPQRYVSISPDLYFQGLDTAVLFEAGIKSAAIVMMAAPKAAVRAGMPTEFIVYPQTGHNLRSPLLKKEAAERNLDWFRFWLLAEEDRKPEKVEQYNRWRKLRQIRDQP